MAGGVVERGRHAEHAHGRVALELVDPAAVVPHDVEDQAEERVEPAHHLVRRRVPREGRRSDDVHEQHRGLPQLATELHAGLERLARDVLAHVAAEEIAQPFPLPEPGRHPVEPGLEEAHLARVVDRHLHVGHALLDEGERAAHGANRLGDRLGC